MAERPDAVADREPQDRLEGKQPYRMDRPSRSESAYDSEMMGPAIAALSLTAAMAAEPGYSHKYVKAIGW